MRRILWLGVIAALALAGTSIAVAAKRDKGTSEVAFAFTASAGDSIKTRTCTGADGTYKTTRAVYGGAIASGRYAGDTATVRLSTTIKDGAVGLAAGQVAIRDGDSVEARGTLTGVVEGTTVSGTILGRDSKGEDRGRLIANFSATLGDGTLALTAGSGSAANSAIVFGGTGCGKKSNGAVTGTVKAITATSITVDTGTGEVTCTLTAEQAARLSRRIEAGDKVSMTCDSAAKLLRIRLKE